MHSMCHPAFWGLRATQAEDPAGYMAMRSQAELVKYLANLRVTWCEEHLLLINLFKAAFYSLFIAFITSSSG